MFYVLLLYVVNVAFFMNPPVFQVYQVCAEILGLKASECVVFEDAPSGICSAKAAGCFTIAVPESWMVGDGSG